MELFTGKGDRKKPCLVTGNYPQVWAAYMPRSVGPLGGEIHQPVYVFSFSWKTISFSLISPCSSVPSITSRRMAVPQFIYVDDTSPLISYQGPWVSGGDTYSVNTNWGEPFGNTLHALSTGSGSFTFNFTGK